MAKLPYPYGLARIGEKYHDFALLLLRIGLSSITLYFGITGLIDYTSTLAWIAPQIGAIIATILPLKAFALILVVSQIIAGLAILTGLFTRLLGIGSFLMISAIIANLYLAAGMVDDVIMRDLALAFASLMLFFFGPGKYSLDRLLELE